MWTDQLIHDCTYDVIIAKNISQNKSGEEQKKSKQKKVEKNVKRAG